MYELVYRIIRVSVIHRNSFGISRTAHLNINYTITASFVRPFRYRQIGVLVWHQLYYRINFFNYSRTRRSTSSERTTRLYPLVKCTYTGLWWKKFFFNFFKRDPRDPREQYYVSYRIWSRVGCAKMEVLRTGDEKKKKKS